MKLDWKWILVLLIILQFFVGVDLTHHLRTTQVYHDMIMQKRLILFDSRLSLEELTFTYGVCAYFFSGLLHFLFGNFSVDAAMIVLYIACFYIVKDYFKDNKNKFYAMLTCFAFLATDAYVAFFVNVFFWMGLLLHKKKSKHYFIPLIIAGLNHPFSLIACLFFVYKDKKNLFWWIPLLIIQVLISLFFSNNFSISFWNIFRLLQAIILRFPIFFAPLLKPKWLKILGIILFSVSCFGLFFNSIYYSFPQPLILVFTNALSDFPGNVSNLRVLDYEYLPMLAQLEYHDFILAQGSFFENNPVKQQIYTNFSSKQEYYNYLHENNITHVLSCKDCIIRSNEIMFLDNTVWSNDYYTLYLVN